MTQHSPTPWEPHKTYGIADADGHCLPILDDAAFIILACNSHDALVAACRDVLASGCWAYLQAGEDLRLRIESALAAAEGKAVQG